MWNAPWSDMSNRRFVVRHLGDARRRAKGSDDLMGGHKGRGPRAQGPGPREGLITPRVQSTRGVMHLVVGRFSKRSSLLCYDLPESPKRLFLHSPKRLFTGLRSEL